jgi:hypothetical protein
MPDWYRTHSLSPEAYPDSEYLAWAQDNGLYVDAAGNVDYGPPEPPAFQDKSGFQWSGDTGEDDYDDES